jgi:electron transfer flavoprotein beta subunit
MKIVCLIKFIPDVEGILYDSKRHVLVRENIEMVLNPDDRAVLALALKLKKNKPEIRIEIISMAPLTILDKFEDLLRLDIDKGTLISDRLYIGSDTYVTSKIIGTYLKKTQYDVILCGTHTLDGDTAHVPAQLADDLGLNHMSHIIGFKDEELEKGAVDVTVELESSIADFKVKLPAVLGISKESKFKLPFVRYDDLELDVSHKVKIINNDEIGFAEEEVGIIGSLTKVSKTWQPTLTKKEQMVLRDDDESIELIVQFLEKEGYLS